MTTTPAKTVDRLQAAFEVAWRDDTPVFGCCRKAVATALDAVDVYEIAPRDATTRVQALRSALEDELPGHLESHRCCSGHLADLAFDLPDLLAPVEHDD